MINDKFGNPVYQEKDIFELFYQGYQNFDEIFVEDSKEIRKFESFLNINLKKIGNNLYDIDIKEFDSALQNDWFIPAEYANMDIEGFLVDRCPKEHYQRLIEELQEYRERNLLPLLKVLKYLVDELRKNNILWGVGRGSSVASYVLYLIGVHKIDSIKYKLDWREFLR